jgi:hypothetical protein
LHKLFAAAFLVLSGQAGLAADRTDMLMDAIEGQVKLPDGSSPDQYNRTYAYLGDGTVIAIYENFDAKPPGRSWAKSDELPQILDGGCSVITIFYSPKDRRITDVMCNHALTGPPPPR